MSSTDIKDVVKEKYAQAALRVTSVALALEHQPPADWAAIRSQPTSIMQRKMDRFPKRLSSLHSGAGTRLLWRN